MYSDDEKQDAQQYKGSRQHHHGEGQEEKGQRKMLRQPRRSPGQKEKDEKEFVALSNGGRCKMILRRGNPRFCRPSPTGTCLAMMMMMMMVMPIS